MSIDKLRGSENYHTWKFAMESVLELNNLQDCITDPITEKDEAKLRKAKARIVLSVHESIYPHIQQQTTAGGIWITLKQLYEDTGLTRKIGLLRNLIATRLENCDSMSDYVNQLINSSNKLSGIGFCISGEWLGAIMLAGLGDEFRPFIMGIESSGVQITGDNVKMKLLDSDYGKPSSQTALYAAKKPKGKSGARSNFKCYSCGRKGHFSKDCRAKKGQNGTTANAFHVLMSRESSRDTGDWYIDSGASRHMTFDSHCLTNITKSTISDILAANNEQMKVKCVGNAKLRFGGNDVDVNDVLLVPDLSTNLLSVAQIVKKGNKVMFDDTGCEIVNASGHRLAKIDSSCGVYKIESQAAQCLLSKQKVSPMTWHRRLGHLNFVDMCKMKNGSAKGISFDGESSELSQCVVCCKGKQTRASFKHTGRRATGVLDLIHSDLCGPMETMSFGGARYFLTFVDDFTHKAFVYLLKTKDEVFNKFKEFKQLVENQKGKKIKSIRTDNGLEYINQHFKEFCGKNGISHQTSCSYTPEQNGLAERINRTIVERAKCMIFDADLEKTYWAEAVNTAVYIINRTVSSAINGDIPEKIWSGYEVDLSHIRIFGSNVMVHVPKQRRRKWDPKSTKMVFVGYSDTTKGYRCYDPQSRRVVISRDVCFMENTKNVQVSVAEEVAESEGDYIDESTISEESIADRANETETFDDASDETYIPDEEVSPINVTRKSNRVPVPRDFSSYVSHMATTGEVECDPTTIEETRTREDSMQWNSAIKSELDSLIENKTWIAASLPAGRKAIKSKWVFNTKRDKDGNILKYKARLVAKGCSQKYGVDYNEVFSPVVRYTSIRFLIALSVKLNMKIDQMDAVTAFLQSDLSEEIYMELPGGCGADSGKICKLNKAIYGLKQSGREWNMKLEKTLKSSGLVKSKMDPCVFYNKNLQLIVAVYVDDILVFWKSAESRDKLKKVLCGAFKMKDLGRANSCIGLNITYDNENGGIWLDQEKYTQDILQRFGMWNSKPVSTPSDVNQKLSATMCAEGEEIDNIPYQEAVGSLLYLAQGTRPDIAFAVNDVSRFNAKHAKAHWIAVKRIFRYLKGTFNYKIFFARDGELQGYTDADWASDIDKRRSCTGYVFTLCGGAISWNSKRQSTVALSSMEAEYMALSAASQEAIWLKQFGQDFDTNIKSNPVQIACDNQSAIAVAESNCYRARTKHIDIRHHYIRDRIDDGTIKVQYIPTEEMIADNLTKAVTHNKTLICIRGMGMQN